MAPRRFLDGVTNVHKGEPFGNMPFLDPTKYSIYYEDYFSPHFGAALNSATATYDGVKYTAGATATIDAAQDGDANGCLSVALATTTDNGLGYAYTVAEAMRLRSGKKFFMETYFEITLGAGAAIGQEELFIGLSESTGIAASVTAFMTTAGTALAADDVIGFVSFDGSAELNVAVSEADVRDIVPLGTAIVDATWYRASLYFDGTDIYYFVNDVAAGAFTPTAIPVSMIGPCVWFKAGEAKNRTLLVDYLFVAAER